MGRIPGMIYPKNRITPLPKEELKHFRNNEIISIFHLDTTPALLKTLRIINTLILEHRNYLFLEAMRDKIDLNKRVEFYLKDKHMLRLFEIASEIREIRRVVTSTRRKYVRSKVRVKEIEFMTFYIEDFDFYIAAYEKNIKNFIIREEREITKNDLL